jgi:protein ImuB
VIPSYDDLTPGIPDVVDSETAANLASLLRAPASADATAGKPAAGARLPASDLPRPASGAQLPAPALFACVRLTGSGQLDADRGPRDGVLAIARDFSPRVRAVSDREVLLDVSGLGRLIGEPPEIAHQLARAIEGAGLKGDVAVAPTQTRARLLATQPADFDISAFPQLPVGVLRPLETLPPGMNHRDRDRPYEIFASWGIATLGDLAALPARDLSSRLGRRGVALHRLARGLDAAPFAADPGTPRYVGRLELEWPIDGLEPLSFVFARLLDPLTAALERADRGAAAIHLALRLTDRSTHQRLLQLPAAMRDARVLRTLLLLDLESHPPAPCAPGEAMIDVVSIELDPAPARITQFSLLQRALPSPETVSTLTARLSALVGEGRVGSAVLIDTHRPDGFEMGRFNPDAAGPPVSARATAGLPTLRDGGQAGPAGESRQTPVLRRQRGSIALCVSVTNGRPVHVAASRRGIPYGAIVEAAGPWRTSGGWWTDRSWSRNEWDVALNGGAVCRIYQDRATDRWFLEGVYD